MSPRGDKERERERRERDAGRTAQPDWVAAPQRRERVEAALARSQSRRSPRSVRQGPNGSGPGYPRRRRRRFFVPLLIVLTLVALVAGWFLISVYQPGKAKGSGRVAVV